MTKEISRAPAVYKSYFGWGFIGCDADIYTSESEALKAAYESVDIPEDSAEFVAAKYGNDSVDSYYTLSTVINPDADTVDGEVDYMDLRVCGFGESAYFEWITESGDVIGNIFYALPETTGIKNA